MKKKLSIRSFTFVINLVFILSLFSPVIFEVNGKCEQTICENFVPRIYDVLTKNNNNVTISFHGGIGIKVEICNYGNTTFYMINWTITIDAPLIIMGVSTTGSISEIGPGECVSIRTGFIFGFGKITITIQIDDIIASASGYFIGPFVFLNE